MLWFVSTLAMCMHAWVTALTLLLLPTIRLWPLCQKIMLPEGSCCQKVMLPSRPGLAQHLVGEMMYSSIPPGQLMGASFLPLA